jgi:hypothetical protein
VLLGAYGEGAGPTVPDHIPIALYSPHRAPATRSMKSFVPVGGVEDRLNELPRGDQRGRYPAT